MLCHSVIYSQFLHHPSLSFSLLTLQLHIFSFFLFFVFIFYHQFFIVLWMFLYYFSIFLFLFFFFLFFYFVELKIIQYNLPFNKIKYAIKFDIDFQHTVLYSVWVCFCVCMIFVLRTILSFDLPYFLSRSFYYQFFFLQFVLNKSSHDEINLNLINFSVFAFIQFISVFFLLCLAALTIFYFS